MASIINRRPVDDIYATRKQKEGDPYLVGMVDYWIGKLMYEKKHIPVCRKYYSGRRDAEEFEYLSDNYGIGNPIDIQFTPIIKPRIDALVGLFLTETFNYGISVSDDKTLSLEDEEKKNFIIGEVNTRFKTSMQQFQQSVDLQAGGQASKEQENPLHEEYLHGLMEYINEDFISVYAKAAQHLVKFFEQDNIIDFKRKSAELLYDLLITGEMNWRTYIREKGKDPVFEIIKPENLFFNKNKNDLFMDSVNAVVHREFYTRHQVIQKFGHMMTSEDKKKLFGIKPSAYGTSRRLADPQRLEDPYYNDDDNVYNQYTGNEFDTVEVYHVEWLASNELDGKTKDGKKGYIEDRYEGYRIGYDIYFGLKKSEDVPRSQNDPYKTSLTYSGMSYNIRQGEAYSMVWNLKDVQDMYDITQFHRNNLVATAGVAGTRVNIAGIPKVLGSRFMERLMKWIALRKQGVELIDPTEEGAQLFNHYGEFQGGIDGNAINGINAILQTLERQVVLTTGVTDQMLGQIEEREAVENVKTGIRQVSLITLNIFDLMSDARKRILTTLINNAKTSYKKGKMGAYRVGSASIAFKIDRKDFVWTDYNIQVTNSSRDALKLQKLEGLVSELVGGGAVKPEVMVNLILADTVAEARDIVRQGLSSDDNEGQMKQMDDQVKQYEQQLKEAGAQAEKLQREADILIRERLNLDKEKLKIESENKTRELNIKEKVATDEARFKEQEMRAKREIVQLEREQLYVEGGNSNAREINNNKI